MRKRLLWVLLLLGAARPALADVAAWGAVLAWERLGAAGDPAALAKALDAYKSYLEEAKTEGERVQARARIDALRRQVASVRFEEIDGGQPARWVRVNGGPWVPIKPGAELHLPPERVEIHASTADPRLDPTAPGWRRSLDLRAGTRYTVRYHPRELPDLRFAVSVGMAVLVGFPERQFPPTQVGLALAFEHRWPIDRHIAADLVIQLPFEISGEHHGGGPAIGGRWALRLRDKGRLEMEFVPTVLVGLMFLYAPPAPEGVCVEVPCRVPGFNLRAHLDLVLRWKKAHELRLELVGVSTGVASEQLLGPRLSFGLSYARRLPRHRFR